MVKAIGKLQMDSAAKDRLYYTLEPLYSEKNTIYTPVDKKDATMRCAITEQEAWNLIDGIQGQMYALPPVRRLAAKLQESNPAYQVFAQQMEHCITRSAYPYWPRITGVLSESLYGVMTGGLSPQEAADAIGSKVRLCIGKNDSG